LRRSVSVYLLQLSFFRTLVSVELVASAYASNQLSGELQGLLPTYTNRKGESFSKVRIYFRRQIGSAASPTRCKESDELGFW
jgi:hypothetical protein